MAGAMAGPASRTHAFSAGPSFLECGLRKWHAVEHETREYLAVLSEESLAQPVCYFSHMGDGFTYELWRPMLHLINRQCCYHRGQVATTAAAVRFAAAYGKIFCPAFGPDLAGCESPTADFSFAARRFLSIKENSIRVCAAVRTGKKRLDSWRLLAAQPTGARISWEAPPQSRSSGDRGVRLLRE